MKYLADTHIPVRAIRDDPKLPARAREILPDPGSLVFYSFANVWKVAIKHALHKQDMNFRHAYPVETPRYADNAPGEHRDPFARLLPAQAKTENMLFLTHDRLIPYYNEPCTVSV